MDPLSNAPAVVVEEEAGILQPLSGELVPADDIAGIAEAIEALRDHQDRVRSAIAAFTRAAVEQSRVHGTKTLVADAFKIEISPDTQVEWDVDELAKLRDAGLPEDRYGELVAQVVETKVSARVASQLAAANPDYKRIIENAKRRVPKTQYATVKSL